MNPLTTQLLEQLWQGDPTFKDIAARLAKQCHEMCPAEAAVIGRDLILRRRALYTREFNLAAYLASDGTAGNDGFMDFIDCVALLPVDRYERILVDPDKLVDDPVSTGFNELYLVSKVSKVFDRALLDGDEDGGLLEYLILGDATIDWSTIEGWTEDYARERLPRLNARFGYLLRESASRGSRSSDSAVTLDDFFGRGNHPR